MIAGDAAGFLHLRSTLAMKNEWFYLLLNTRGWHPNASRLDFLKFDVLRVALRWNDTIDIPSRQKHSSCDCTWKCDLVCRYPRQINNRYKIRNRNTSSRRKVASLDNLGERVLREMTIDVDGRWSFGFRRGGGISFSEHIFQ